MSLESTFASKPGDITSCVTTESDARPSAPLSRLLRYARPYRRTMLAATGYSVLNQLFDLAPPLLIGAAVDIVVEKETSFMSRAGIVDVELQLWALAGLTVVVWGLESLFEYLLDVKWRGLAQDIQHALRMDVFRKTRHLNISEQEVGGVVCVLNDDVNQLERFLDGCAGQLVQLATTLLLVGAMFVYMVPSVAWMTFLPMPFVVWGSLWFQKRLKPRYAAVRAEAGRLANQLSCSLDSSRRDTTPEETATRVEVISRDYMRANVRAIHLSSLFVPLIRMVIVLGFGAMLVFGGKLALAGELKLGVYSVMVFMTQRLLWPLTGLGGLFDRYQRAMASTARALDLLDATSSSPDQ